MNKLEIQVPALGESITEATVAKWFYKKGDEVKKDEVILELETDKVSQEIYAAESGKLSEVFFQEGDVGKYKVDVLKNHIEKLNSNCDVSVFKNKSWEIEFNSCLLYTSPSPRD